MPDPEAVAEVVRGWWRSAEQDLVMAMDLATNPEVEPWGPAFHGQQAIEKAFKAALVAQGAVIPRSHDLVELRRLLHGSWGIDTSDDRLDRFSMFAAPTRYPIDEAFGALAPDAGEMAEVLTFAERTLGDLRERFTAIGIFRPDPPTP